MLLRAGTQLPSIRDSAFLGARRDGDSWSVLEVAPVTSQPSVARTLLPDHT